VTYLATSLKLAKFSVTERTAVLVAYPARPLKKYPSKFNILRSYPAYRHT